MLGAAVIAMGLLAMRFYAFDVAVMPALTAADDRTPRCSRLPIAQRRFAWRRASSGFHVRPN